MPALIFDCDGVLADTERDGHRPAFNQAFAEAGLPVAWSEAGVRPRLKIGGGKERIASLFPDADAERERIAALHKRKTAIYKEIVRTGRLPGRPGVARIVDEALAAGWTLAVASTSAEESVRAVLEHVVGDGDRGALRRLRRATSCRPRSPTRRSTGSRSTSSGVAPDDAIVVEDSRNGLLAAVGAGLRCVVTLSSYTGEEDMREAALVVTSLGDPGAPGARRRQPQRRASRRPGHDRRSRGLPDRTPVRGGGCMSDTALAPGRAGRQGDRPDGGRQRDLLLRARRGRRRRRLRLLARARLRERALRLGRAGVRRRRRAAQEDRDRPDQADRRHVGADLGHRVPARRRILAGNAEPTADEVVAALRAAIEGIKQRGNSDLGDKTLLDALVPAVDALEARSATAPRSRSSARPQLRGRAPRRPRGCSPSAGGRPTPASAAAARSTRRDRRRGAVRGREQGVAGVGAGTDLSGPHRCVAGTTRRRRRREEVRQ